MTAELTLRYMQVSDIPEVVVIDTASFNPPWPESSYRFELHESNITHMAIVEKQEIRPVQGWRQFFSKLRGEKPTLQAQGVVVAYGGLWQIADEAHISTIATHPDYRGRKYGEIVLAGLLGTALRLNAAYVVLEVRVSNQIAQGLYRKYGFEIHGVKREYYHHNNEDAYDMRVNLTADYAVWFQKQLARLGQEIHFVDKYTTTPHPRLGQ